MEPNEPKAKSDTRLEIPSISYPARIKALEKQVKSLAHVVSLLKNDLYADKWSSTTAGFSKSISNTEPNIGGYVDDLVTKEAQEIEQTEMPISAIAEALDSKKHDQQQIVDIVDGHVYDIDGDGVYTKFSIGGVTYKASFTKDIFERAGAAFVGAMVQFLTVTTEDPKKPYDLKIKLKSEQPLQELSPAIIHDLKTLHELENDTEKIALDEKCTKIRQKSKK
jgi:hypothetical protein